MEYLSKKATDYFTKNYKLSNINSAKVKYSIDVILNEVFKLILLLLMFSIIGELKAFVYCCIILLLFRPLLGGFHLNGFISCYIFTILFFGSVIFLSNRISISIHLLSFLFVFNLITIIKFRLISLSDKHQYTTMQRILHTNIPIVALCIHFIIYLFKSDSLYFKISICTITLHSIQLIIAKGIEYYEKRKKFKTD